jgi:hypothetical protein
MIISVWNSGYKGVIKNAVSGLQFVVKTKIFSNTDHAAHRHGIKQFLEIRYIIKLAVVTARSVLPIQICSTVRGHWQAMHAVGLSSLQ